ncbi:putative xyloglucan endotransglucosylase/hydrolase protein 30 [Iris pallida]|uniref:Xyloglucan endotransglucosylase/hydrolase n=1 Tax=Iris pallida TaxID=29817 RepID=A0AAX6H647_IRIPA|nr:putative xyloglucan endotransglucosylase/hydrolase protein 30 [Iris pallida]
MATLLLLLFLAAFVSAAVAFDSIPTISFDEGYKPLFGDGNIVKSNGGRNVNLELNRWSGAGFISSDLYNHGFFSASIKLPSDYTAGVVVAFYTSNGDLFEHTHDELDFEFLGNIKGKEWRIQTNVYGNGSTSRGREERYLLPFDPTAEPHRYSILWTADTIIFYIDNIPIREVLRSGAMGGDYPSKPMALYATIWDGSLWATQGGKYKANYKYSPWVAEFSGLVLQGCRTDPRLVRHPSSEEDDRCADSDAQLEAADFADLTPKKREAMRRFRGRYMTYSFCYDENRYPVAFPDCDVVPSEQEKFWKSGDVKVDWEKVLRRRKPRQRSKRRSRVAARGVEEDKKTQAAV